MLNSKSEELIRVVSFKPVSLNSFDISRINSGERRLGVIQKKTYEAIKGSGILPSFHQIQQ